ncbi:MAG: nuclear transport factor 2 family protein [Pseudomonadota bacterium]
MTAMTDKRAVLEAFYREVWQEGHLDRIGTYFALGGEARGLLPDLDFTPDDLRDLIAVNRERIDQIETRILHVVEQGDWLSALLEMRGVSIDTETPVVLTGQLMARFDATGKIAEVYNSFDFLSYFEQLGQLPRNVFPLLLTGAVFR